jgi:hypothetical protein
MTAATGPAIVLAWRPAAERTSDAGAGRVVALGLVGLPIHNNRGLHEVIREGAHAKIMTQFRINRGVQVLSECR